MRSLSPRWPKPFLWNQQLLDSRGLYLEVPSCLALDTCFLMNVRNLVLMFVAFLKPCLSAGDLSDSREKEKAKRRKKSAEKKKRGKIVVMHSCSPLLCNPNILMSGREESSVDSSSDEEIAISSQEKQKILGLTIRDMKFGVDVSSLGDLSPRQFAHVLSGAYAWLLPTDLLEIGGECDSCLNVLC